LGKFFGTSPEFWVNLQAQYDLETQHWYEAHGIGRKEIKFKRPINGG